jgi:hypothetical protein
MLQFLESISLVTSQAVNFCNNEFISGPKDILFQNSVPGSIEVLPGLLIGINLLQG